ncbi:hypothetical protein PF008_g21090 [Phytophthora fragariae]|uniref:RxLR effector protein n=1 Tax=Phytophthora fragariae TaxID=53985 RepID=A0A6G0QXL7_9STRA|nr:hypothetical protein PF008_g21090 [Phytophthora fragariae]
MHTTQILALSAFSASWVLATYTATVTNAVSLQKPSRQTPLLTASRFTQYAAAMSTAQTFRGDLLFAAWVLATSPTSVYNATTSRLS